MARASTAELLQSLWERVIVPLVSGGELVPIRPIGPSRAAALAAGSSVFRASDASLIDALRVRQARALWPADGLDEPNPAQWMMAAALNDLLQCTNPSLDGMLSRRSAVLIDKVEQTLAAVEPPPTVREALSRHGTFGRLLSLQRQDTRLTWWCGRQEFLGRSPPPRMLRWKKLRRVASETALVGLPELAGSTWVEPGRYRGVLAGLLALSPLTDLAAAARSEPAFAWTGPTLAMLSCAPGRTLAVRALRFSNPGESLQALQRAPAPRDPAWNAAVQSVMQELSEYARAS